MTLFALLLLLLAAPAANAKNRRTYTDDELRKAVAENFSMAGTLRAIGVVPVGGNYKTTKRVIVQLGLDTSHWTGQGHMRGRRAPWVAARARPLEEILVRNSPSFGGVSLKERLIKAGLLENQCAKCGIRDQWQGEPIALHMDHVNGDNTDQRLENLRILCALCRARHNQHYADLRIMPSWAGCVTAAHGCRAA